MNNRESLLKKIRALMAKTIENGCSEAEAMSALSMAQAMMDANEVTEADIEEIKQENAIIDYSSPKDTHKIGWKICYSVGKFTETYSYGNPSRIKFVGLRSDVEFAIWLNEALVLFIRNQLKTYLWANELTGLPPAAKRRIINGFVIGCAGRIGSRLNKLASERHSNNGAALVVAKDALIKNAIAGENIKEPDNRGRKTIYDGAALRAGAAAGDKATFGRPVEGQVSVKLIGRG